MSVSAESTKPVILLTGGAGYIGIHTAVQLANSGLYKGIVADNNIPSRLRLVVSKLVPEGSLEFVEMDLARDMEGVKKLKFDGVIHFAALKAVGESVEQPLRYYRNNINCHLNVLEACAQQGCKVFLFSSSATVYCPNEDLLTESSPIGASNPYGQTKVIGEQIIKDYCIANTKMQAMSLRYFNPIGAHPSGTIGEAPEHPQNILPIIQKVALGKMERVTVMGNDWPTPDGTGVRDYIHVMDLADGHLLALKQLLSQAASPGSQNYSVYNLGTGRGYSVLEMINIFQKVNNVKVPHVIGPRRPGDLSSVVCSPKKAEQELGFKATRSVEDACESAWKWQSNNPNGLRD